MTCILTGRGLEGWEWADAGRMFDTYTHTNSISHYLHHRKASQLFTRIPVEHMSKRVHCKRWFLDCCYTEIKYETLSDVSWITWGSYDAWKHFIVIFFLLYSLEVIFEKYFWIVFHVFRTGLWCLQCRLHRLAFGSVTLTISSLFVAQSLLLPNVSLVTFINRLSVHDFTLNILCLVCICQRSGFRYPVAPLVYSSVCWYRCPITHTQCASLITCCYMEFFAEQKSLPFKFNCQ